jgi:hypothetical protein
MNANLFEALIAPLFVILVVLLVIYAVTDEGDTYPRGRSAEKDKLRGMR